MSSSQTIFKRDTTGKVRVWRQEIAGPNFRTVAGILDGAMVESGWTRCIGKQGRTDEQQAEFEVASNYEHKLSREYHPTMATIDGGAHFFKPMLAQKYEAFAPGYAQPKLDGVRCIVTAAGMFSREGKPIMGAPHIHERLEPLFAADPSLTLDGEIYNHDFKDDFNAIVSIVKKQTPNAEQLKRSAELAQYWVYDMPSHPGNFSDRIHSIHRLFDGRWSMPLPSAIKIVQTSHFKTPAEYDKHHGTWLEDGYEGSMWRADAPYENKRSKHLLKRKDFVDAEFEVVSIEEGLGNWAGCAKRVTCRLPDGRTFGTGIAGTQVRARELLTETHKVATIKYFMLTPDGIPRFGVATKFHGEERTL